MRTQQPKSIPIQQQQTPTGPQQSKPDVGPPINNQLTYTDQTPITFRQSETTLVSSNQTALGPQKKQTDHRPCDLNIQNHKGFQTPKAYDVPIANSGWGSSKPDQWDSNNQAFMGCKHASGNETRRDNKQHLSSNRKTTGLQQSKCMTSQKPNTI